MRRTLALTIGSLALLALLLTTITADRPAVLGDRAAAAPAADETLLRELAERLLSPGAGPPGQPIPTPHLLPGELPDDLPLTLPEPPGARLLGSVARRADGTLFGADIIYDAPGTSADLLAFYESALAPQGWVPASISSGQASGFLPSNSAAGRAFCTPQHQSEFMIVQATTRADAPLDLRLHLERTSAGPCGQGPVGPSRPMGAERLPALVAPAGVQVSNSGGGGSSNRYTSSAYATTALSVAELHEAYAAQLAAAGWIRAESGVDGPLAWSTWQIPGDGNFAGFLYVLRTAVPDQRELFVEAAAPYTGSVPAPTRPVPVPATPQTTGQPVVTPTTVVPSTP